MSAVFQAAIAEAAFPEEGKFTIQIAGWHVLIAKVEDAFHAVNDRCPHAASMLSTGRIRRGAVMCPLHGARFDLVTGTCIGGAYSALRTFPLRITEGMIEVAVPSSVPGMADLPVKTG
jgi:anthranilate 1,2-dioxygenase ferredoxin component